MSVFDGSRQPESNLECSYSCVVVLLATVLLLVMVVEWVEAHFTQLTLRRLTHKRGPRGSLLGLW